MSIAEKPLQKKALMNEDQHERERRAAEQNGERHERDAPDTPPHDVNRRQRNEQRSQSEGMDERHLGCWIERHERPSYAFGDPLRQSLHRNRLVEHRELRSLAVHADQRRRRERPDERHQKGEPGQDHAEESHGKRRGTSPASNDEQSHEQGGSENDVLRAREERERRQRAGQATGSFHRQQRREDHQERQRLRVGV